MQEADNVGEHLAIVVEVGRRAHEPDVAAEAGKILPELGQQSRSRILVVVERIVRERITHQRGGNRPIQNGAFHGERRLAVHVAVGGEISVWRSEGRRRTQLVRGREGGHEIRIDVVTIRQIGRQHDFLLIERIAQLQAEILAQRKAEPGAEADRVGLVRDIARRQLLLVEHVDAPRHPITEEVRVHVRHRRTLRILAVLYRDLSEQTAPEQIAFRDAHLSQESVGGRITAGDGELAGRLLLDIDVDNDSIGSRTGFGRYSHGLEIREILQTPLGPIDKRAIVGITFRKVELAPDYIIARARIPADVDPFDVGALPFRDSEDEIDRSRLCVARRAWAHRREGKALPRGFDGHVLDGLLDRLGIVDVAGIRPQFHSQPRRIERPDRRLNVDRSDAVLLALLDGKADYETSPIRIVFSDRGDDAYVDVAVLEVKPA